MCEICEVVTKMIAKGEALDDEQKAAAEEVRSRVCLKCGKHEPLLEGAGNPPAPHAKHVEGLSLFEITACDDCGIYLKLADQEPQDAIDQTVMAATNPRIAFFVGVLTEKARVAQKARRENELVEAVGEGLTVALKNIAKKRGAKATAEAPAQPAEQAPAPEAPAE